LIKFKMTNPYQNPKKTPLSIKKKMLPTLLKKLIKY